MRSACRRVNTAATRSSACSPIGSTRTHTLISARSPSCASRRTFSCGATASSALPDYLDDIERKAIIEALGKTGFNRTAAAKLLGITFRQLRYRMQRLGIKDDTKA